MSLEAQIKQANNPNQKEALQHQLSHVIQGISSRTETELKEFTGNNPDIKQSGKNVAQELKP
ncbi:hypothetical protein [Oenococcus kitaharae]|uniref:Uncharacterized protein n=1 Tax=Oenococcus kitaharae DSM 17330 TaxID=1045004 RepID=G9WHN0_9LACO|nr:hypothetical protein [Oenococcus kitaharae]EHN58604.1 hypothetical protein OKIT_0488 [Oenococcus kitaharae DSM 17330]